MNDSGAAKVTRIEPAYLGLDRLFSAARDAVIIGESASGRIVLWNDAATKIFGYSQQEALELLIEDLVPTHLKEQHRAGLRRYARTGKGVLIDSHQVIELPALRQDGTEIEIELTLTPLETDRLTGRFVMAIVRDITERKRSEDELTRLNQSLRDFVAVAAHDIRSPLTTIQGLASLLASREGALESDENRTALETIERQARHLARLVDGLLTISKIESNALDVHPLETEVLPVISRVVGDLGRSSDVTIQGESKLTAMVDPDHLERMVRNYLTNAFHYGAPPIRVTVERIEREVIISVYDSGRGVGEELAPRLFDKFARSDDSGARGGSGLGLSIARGLAQANGGEAWYEPSESKGACFRLTLRA